MLSTIAILLLKWFVSILSVRVLSWTAKTIDSNFKTRENKPNSRLSNERKKVKFLPFNKNQGQKNLLDFKNLAEILDTFNFFKSKVFFSFQICSLFYSISFYNKL